MVTQADVQLPSAEDLTAIAALVWSSYLSADVYVTAAGGPTSDAVSASVSIGGAWSGHVVIETDPATARGIAAAMFALGIADMSDSEVGDALGEMANIIGGNVKALMPEPSVLSLPQVDLACGARDVPSAQPVSQVDLRWEGGSVRISLWSEL